MKTHHKKRVIIIAGPTAAGKTAIGIAIAQHFNTEIISADSRQCYKELSIGVARPSAEELAAVPHHFIASHSIHDKVTAATFEACALEKAAALFQQHDTIVMAGGTGLYIKAFCEGLDFIPDTPEHIRQELIAAYEEKGLTWLQETVRREDATFYTKGEIENPHRLIRALEVKRTTGQSVLHFRTAEKKERAFDVIQLVADVPRVQLHTNINNRVDAMMAAGLPEEVMSLLSWQHLTALQTVGYKELLACFNEKDTLTGSIEKIKAATRQYAKRQITWFRKTAAAVWLPPAPEAMLQYINRL